MTKDNEPLGSEPFSSTDPVAPRPPAPRPPPVPSSASPLPWRATPEVPGKLDEIDRRKPVSESPLPPNINPLSPDPLPGAAPHPPELDSLWGHPIREGGFKTPPQPTLPDSEAPAHSWWVRMREKIKHWWLATGA